jgi:hypothetical protein
MSDSGRAGLCEGRYKVKVLGRDQTLLNEGEHCIDIAPYQRRRIEPETGKHCAA